MITQVVTIPWVAEKKDKATFNYSVPPELKEAFEEVATPFGDKKRWAVITSAVLMFVEAPEAVRSRYVGLVVGADSTDGVQPLIQRARSRKLREDIDGSVRMDFETEVEGDQAKKPAAHGSVPAKPEQQRERRRAADGKPGRRDRPK